MLFVGDVHAAFDRFRQIVNATEEPVFQVGDLGIGFPKIAYPMYLRDGVRFLRGNHDNPTVCRVHPNYAGDWGYDEAYRLFFVSGAWSIDWQYRTPGYDYWFEEELPPGALSAMLSSARELVEKAAPVDLVVTHDCPSFVFKEMFPQGGVFSKGVIPTRTTTALNKLWGILKPPRWVFGHHHISRRVEVGGTEFICLNILETLSLETLSI